MDVEWIKAQFERTKKGKSALAIHLGLSPSAISSLLAGTRTIKLAEVPKIRAFFGEGENSPSLPPVQKNVLTYVKIVGEVAGGIWAEPKVQHEQEVTTIPVDPKWPAEAMFLLRVRGNSINRKARDGDLVLCLDAWAAPRKAAPGDWVVVERTRDGLIETTVKQIGEGRDGLVLRPASDDPLFQASLPIGEQESETITVKAFVLRFVREATIF